MTTAAKLMWLTVAIAIQLAGCGLSTPTDEDAVRSVASASSTRRLDASFEGVGAYAGYTYLVRDGKYRRYSWSLDANNDGGSLPLFAFHLPPAYHAGVDAAVRGHSSSRDGDFSGYTYFFKGANYVRYKWPTGSTTDPTSGRVTFEWTTASGFKLPAPFSSHVTAALNGKPGTIYERYTYFFEGSQWVGYDWLTDTVSPIQSLSSWHLPYPFYLGIDSVIQGQGAYADKTYFIRGDQYVRYNWSTDTVDPAASLATYWPAISGLDAAPTRRMMLYTTLDDYDGHNYQNHPELVANLQTVAQSSLSNIFVDDWWAPNVTNEMLQDPHVLAIYGAGSFPDWIGYYTGLATHTSALPAYTGSWKNLLDGYAAQVLTTNVPIFAVCGSHQFIGFAFQNWDAVAHMGAKNTSPLAEPHAHAQVTIAQEHAGVPLPAPADDGEFGLMGVHSEVGDPIFAGLSSRWFVDEEHRNEVVDGSYSPAFSRIATYDTWLSESRFGWYTPNDNRSVVQMLRYTASDRVLYTTQFHPEANARVHPEAPVANADAANASSTRLIGNFVQIAQSYWATH